MRILSWNIRGLGSKVKKSSIKKFCQLHRVNVCFIQETEMEMISKEEVRKLWGDDSCEFRFIAAIGKSGGLLTMWSIDDFLVSNVWCDDRVLIIEGKWVKEDLEAVLVNIYAPNILRNFNVVRCKSERSCCWGSEKGTREFENFIFDCNLIDLPLENKKSRLDKFLLDEFWLLKMKDLQQIRLKRSVSDHIPILLADAEVD
ncbi:hypothetical protein E1A91_A11G328800v1 [Gossypium mustelinum]|uniref:Endonuclease/exonuclease/phosphatase domain-containing protein n=1 Tax=Gossypium mustelinum TaxID=34275 RepID=A0A5D2XE57_GOSMU|nr:hypothetical protein E1A91_A11G328800v1 [Gossypium mustelinum]